MKKIKKTSSKPKKNQSLIPKWESATSQLVLTNHRYEQIDSPLIEPIEEKLDAFQCGIGHGNDLKIIKQYEEEYKEWFDVTAKVYGYRQFLVKQYPAVRFKYRLKAVGVNHIPTTQGEIKLQIKAAPIENVSYSVLKYAIRPVKVKIRVRFEVEYYELNQATSEFKIKKQTLCTDPFEIQLNQQVERDEETGTYALKYIEKTRCHDKTILQLIREKALTIPAIEYSDRHYGLNFYGIIIEDDYPFDIGDESVRYQQHKKRTFDVSTYGTLKITANMINNEYDVNSYLYYEGFANEGFFFSKVSFSKDINALENDKHVLLTREALGNLPLVNIDDTSETLETPNFDWMVIEETKGANVEVQIKTEGEELVIASLSSVYETEILTYGFDDVTPYVSIALHKLIPGMSYHLTQQYKYRISVIEQTGNIQVMGYFVESGKSIQFTGASSKLLRILAQYRSREEEWCYTYPASNEPGIEGVVNGDFIHIPDGKRDYEVYAPAITIPDTVDTVRYYIEFDLTSETEHSIQVKFEHESGDGVGYLNNDKVTFSSNVYHYITEDIKEFLFENVEKDLEIEDLNLSHFKMKIKKPDLLFSYKRYGLELHSSSKDVTLLEYPNDLQFVNNECEVSFSARIQQNAIGRWSPKIHNGFYYLNQHEYYMPSKFSIDGDFVDQTEYKEGLTSFTVQIECVDDDVNYQEYELAFSDRTLFKFNEEEFILEDGMLSPKPIVDTPYCKEYQYREYFSPVLEMPNEIVEWQTLDFESIAEHGATVRIYGRVKKTIGEGWNEWKQCFSGEPLPLEAGRFLQFKIEFNPYLLEDTFFVNETDSGAYSFRKIYSEDSVNVIFEDGVIRGINDSFEAEFLTTILDYGTTTKLALSGLGSSSQIKYYIATADEKSKLINPTWKKVQPTDRMHTERYARFKVIIPPGEELYLLYRKAEVLIKNVGIMKVGNFVIRGAGYEAKRDDKIVKVFNQAIPYDGQEHVVSVTLKKLLRPIVEEQGYNFEHIHYFTLTSNDERTEVIYDPDDLYAPVALRYSEKYLASSQTPAVKFYGNKSIIKGIPQQFSPLIVETEKYGPLTEVFFRNKEGGVSLRNEEVFYSQGQRIFPLQFLNYDFETIEIEIEGITNDTRNFIYHSQGNERYYTYVSREYSDFFDPTYLYVRLLQKEEVEINERYFKEMNEPGLLYGKYNQFIEFNQWIPEGAKIKVSYCLRNSFVTTVDEEAGTIQITTNTDEPIEEAFVSYETNRHSHSKTLDHLSLNPIYSNRYNGFIYLTYDTFAPTEIEIYASHTLLRAGKEDKVYIYLRLLDENKNPVPNETVIASGSIGMVTASDTKTDANGVLSFVYQSPRGSGDDKIEFTCSSNQLKEILKLKIV